MKSYQLKIAGKKLNLPLSSSQKWTFTHHPGGWIIATNQAGIRRKIMLQVQQGRLSTSLRGYLWFGEWLNPSREASTGQGSDADLVAQFPGKVRKILVKSESTVQEGDSLLLVEAMKMEFAVRAPFSGRVTQILVKEGQQISPGDRFMDLEADQNGK